MEGIFYEKKRKTYSAEYEPLPPTLRLEAGDFSVNMLKWTLFISIFMKVGVKVNF
jgi:hypothetical protein